MRRSTCLEIKVAAGASKNALQGYVGDVLKVAVTAPPERGKANKAVCALLAKQLEIAPGALRVVRGATKPRKTLEIAGLDTAELDARLKRALP